MPAVRVPCPGGRTPPRKPPYRTSVRIPAPSAGRGQEPHPGREPIAVSVDQPIAVPAHLGRTPRSAPESRRRYRSAVTWGDVWRRLCDLAAVLPEPPDSRAVTSRCGDVADGGHPVAPRGCVAPAYARGKPPENPLAYVKSQMGPISAYHKYPPTVRRRALLCRRRGLPPRNPCCACHVAAQPPGRGGAGRRVRDSGVPVMRVRGCWAGRMGGSRGCRARVWRLTPSSLPGIVVGGQVPSLSRTENRRQSRYGRVQWARAAPVRTLFTKSAGAEW